MMFVGASFHGVGKEKGTYLPFSGTLGNGEESLWQCREKATCRGNRITHSASLGRLKPQPPHPDLVLCLFPSWEEAE